MKSKILFACILAMSDFGTAKPLVMSPITIVAGGDVLLDRNVRKAIAVMGDPEYPFREIRPYLQIADVALANLECPLTERYQPLVKRVNFRGDPSMAAILHRVGFDVLGLANNHVQDHGKIALLETLDNLKRVGIKTIGAGKNQSEAARSLVMHVHDRRIALLAFVDTPLEGLALSDDEPGPAIADDERVASAVKEAKRRADFVLVSVHWGVEHQRHPSARQRALARIIADSGADLVLGHHPHVVQPVERVGNAWVFYSIGNLIFDQHCRDCDWSLLIRAILSDNRRVQAMPVRIRRCQPAPESARPAREKMERLSRISTGVKFTAVDAIWWNVARSTTSAAQDLVKPDIAVGSENRRGGACLLPRRPSGADAPPYGSMSCFGQDHVVVSTHSSGRIFRPPAAD
jgi:poly-gamma-glutamate synthesis protein (capsule biosynthesis protein)